MSLRTTTYVMQVLCAVVGLMAGGAGAFAIYLGRYDLAAVNLVLLFMNIALFAAQSVIRNRTQAK